MEFTLERIRSIRDQMNDIEKRIHDDSLTDEQRNELDDEWEMLDAELAMYDEILFLQELEIIPEEDDDWTNPSDEDVERWDLERQRMSGWGYEGEGMFDLADEI